MKKVIYNQYGDFSQLQMIDTAVPAVASDEVLVKVKAVAINPLDWKLLEGQLKFLTGKKFPRDIGIEFSGTIESLGSSVLEFKIGDRVFGMLDAFKGGALAEFLSIKKELLSKIPEGLSFEQAAAIPIGAQSAIQLIDSLSKVKKGDEVLINGATGGVGVFAIQMAKLRGAVLTSVVSGRGVELARSLGSDFVIDYSKEKFLESENRYDVMIDLSDRLSFGAAKHLLKKKSVYASLNPHPVNMAASAINNIFSTKKRRILNMKYSSVQMGAICRYIENGLKVVVGNKYEFKDFREAYIQTKKSGTLGKSVILI
jgi:NADPH:quinone reductase-like Zn-dependent oxidoreductase